MSEDKRQTRPVHPVKTRIRAYTIGKVQFPVANQVPDALKTRNISKAFYLEKLRILPYGNQADSKKQEGKTKTLRK